MKRLLLFVLAFILWLSAISVLTGPASRAQNRADAPKPSFEVASVKANVTGDAAGAFLRQPGGRFVATNVALKALILYAYRVRADQISGGPSWIGADHWNIEAKAAEGTLPTPAGPPDMTTPDGYALRLQSLLEDRFQLKMHRETKDLPAYNLVVVNGGPKMKLSEDQSPLPYLGATLPPPQSAGPMPRGLVRPLGSSPGMEGTAVSLPGLAGMLSQLSMVGRPVIDKTGLTGLYDFKLEWTPEVGQGPAPGPGAPPQGDTSGPSIFTALQEQLGLKLESTKAPVEILVIDHVEKPSEN